MALREARKTTKEYTEKPIKQDNVAYFLVGICLGSEKAVQNHPEWEHEEFVAGE